MERIQIGDEVLITGVQDKLEAAVGRTGIVISVLSEGDWILVKFPERFDPRLHGGGMVKDPDKCCWGFSPEKWQKLNFAPINTGDINILL